jgi:ribosomal protein S18 acetylase RimI-like enzyme
MPCLQPIAGLFSAVKSATINTWGDDYSLGLPSTYYSAQAIMIRGYCSNDWEAVRQIYDLAKPDEMRGVVPTDLVIPLNSNPVMLSLFEESEILVFELEGVVAGFGGYRNQTITYLFVHPEHRRKGVASRLVVAILNMLGGEAKLNVAKKNGSAYQLYSRLGFVTETEFEGQYNGYPCEVARMRHYSPK